MKKLIFILLSAIFILSASADTATNNSFSSVELSDEVGNSQVNSYFPKDSHIIADEAGILSKSSIDTLYELLSKAEHNSTNQIWVVTVKSLGGYEIEKFANELFRKIGLGQKDKNNGVLLLIAPNEKRVRIEVGYGLEGILTDYKSKKIINEQILPYFKKSEYEKGVINGAKAIVDLLDNSEAQYISDKQKGGIFSLILDKFGKFILFSFAFLGGAVDIIIILYVFSKILSSVVKNSKENDIDVLSSSRRQRSNDSWSSSESWGSSSSSSSSSGGGGGSSGGGGASGSW